MSRFKPLASLFAYLVIAAIFPVAAGFAGAAQLNLA